MARYGSLRRALLTCTALACAVPAAGQSLADVARKAEAQRRESDVEPQVLKAPARPDGPVILTHGLVSEYLRARIAFADVRRADRQLDFRLKKAMSARVMRYYANYLPILEAEPAVADTLAGFGFTPASYLFVEQALMRGWSLKDIRGDRLIPAEHAENIQFVFDNLDFVDATLMRGLQAEHKLQSCCVVLLPE